MVSWLFGVWRAARLLLSLPLCASTMLLGLDGDMEWPGPEPAGLTPPMDDQELIQARRLCISNSARSAGDIGEKVVFRSRRVGDLLRVSYFVYWSTESPWGSENALSSLAIDIVYSHFLFVLPGLRYAIYGPGDIEGATVIYRVRGRRLEIVEGIADTKFHRQVALTKRDLDDTGQGTVLRTNVWSHQLGAHSQADDTESWSAIRRCYEGAELVPLTAEIAKRFRLGTVERPLRARPAWQ